MCYVFVCIRHRNFHGIVRFGIIYTAEIWAIIKALEQNKDSLTFKYIIFTDIRSCLQALIHMKREYPLTGMVRRIFVFLNCANKDIILCCVPSHIGIRGTEKKESSAKSVLDLPRVKEVGVLYILILNIESDNIFSHFTR